MFRVPRPAQALLYVVLATLLLLCVTGLMREVVPGKVGVTLSRNSEAYLTLLAVCVWIDVVRPRLRVHARQWAITVCVAVALFAAGLALRQAPWPPRVVTLNEALIGIAVLVVYLQLQRPIPRWAFAVPALGILVPLIGWDNAFTTDMAEAFGALVLIPLIVDVIDPRLLDGGPPTVLRNVAWMVGLLVFVVVIHLVSDGPRGGLVTGVTYYVQRSTEMFVAAAAMLGYYALRRLDPAAGLAREDDGARQA